MRLGGYPAPFREMLGLRVEDFAPMAEGETNRMVSGEGAAHTCDIWADLILPEGAKVLARYEDASYLFLLNHKEVAVRAEVPAGGRDLLGGGEVRGASPSNRSGRWL